MCVYIFYICIFFIYHIYIKKTNHLRHFLKNKLGETVSYNPYLLLSTALNVIYIYLFCPETETKPKHYTRGRKVTGDYVDIPKMDFAMRRLFFPEEHMGNT